MMYLQELRRCAMTNEERMALLPSDAMTLLCGKARRHEQHDPHRFDAQASDDSPDVMTFHCPGFGALSEDFYRKMGR